MAAAPFYVHVKYARQKKICHSEQSVSGVEESSHFVYVCSEIGAKIHRLRCALHSFAQDDNFFFAHINYNLSYHISSFLTRLASHGML